MTDDIRAAALAAVKEKTASFMGEAPSESQVPEVPEPPEVPETPELMGEESHEEQVLETPETPEGHQSYEEYIESGGDPDYYKGPKAYEQGKDFVNQIKELRGALSEQKEMVFQINQFHEQQREQEQQKLLMEKSALESQLAQMQEAGLYSQEDFNRYEGIKNRVGQIEGQTKPDAPVEQKEHSVFAAARESDPRLNHNHPDFDFEYNALVEARVNESVGQAFTRNGNKPLTDNELAAHLKAAQESVGKKHKPKPTRVPENPPPTRQTKQANKIPAVIADQIKKWEQSSDPIKKDSAKRMKLKYGVK